MVNPLPNSAAWTYDMTTDPLINEDGGYKRSTAPSEPPSVADIAYWPKSLMWTLNLTLAVLIVIAFFLGSAWVRDLRAEQKAKRDRDVCQYFEDSDLPAPSYC